MYTIIFANILILIPTGHKCPDPSESPISCDAGYYSDGRGSISCQNVSKVYRPFLFVQVRSETYDV